MTHLRPAAITIACGLVLSACVDTDEATNDARDVFEMKVDCPTASPCKIADGNTPVRVRLCLKSDRRRPATVPATVRTSTGQWLVFELDQKTATSVDLAGTQCAAVDGDSVYRELWLIPGRDPGPARIDATVESFAVSADFLLGSAPFGDIELRPAIFDIGAASTIAVTATVHATVGGPPSKGTWVEFEVEEVTPSGALATMNPTRVESDMDGKAEATLQTSTGVTSVRVSATAHGREIDGMSPPPLSRELTLTDLP